MLNLKVRRRPRALYISCFQLLIILSPVRVISGPINSFCQRPNVTTTYRANLHSLLSTLLENSFQGKGFFYNSTTPSGLGSGDKVYALYLCRGDLGIDTCNQCVSTAIRELPNICNKTKTGIAWYDACFLRYSSDQPDYEYESLFSTACNPLDVDVTQMDKFNQTRGRIMEEIIIQASNGGGKKFAVQEANYSSHGKIFGLAQCIPDLSNDACEICLREAMSHIPSSSCDKKQGGRVLLPSCILQFENFHFYNVQSPPPAFSPPPPPISSHLSTKRKRRRSVMVIALVSIISLLSIVMLFAAAYFFLRRRSKKKKKGNNLIAQETDGKEILTDESLQYNLSQIQAATNSFCSEQKIGEGGFGSVYKGILPNGQEIAVKRLSGTSGQVAMEFKNEIALVAKLQHRNLVRLLGFCFEGEERILIYEYVPNKSLDNVLFGNNYCNDTEKQLLDWSRRRKIIEGIARGLLYIHEDSRLRVIHRDVKASNVLLDEDMEPKIADSGLARIFWSWSIQRKYKSNCRNLWLHGS